MSPKCKFYQNTNVTERQMSPDKKCHQNSNVKKLKHHQNTNFIKMQKSQNPNVTKTQMSPKPKCHQNTNVPKTQVSPKRKCHQNINFTTCTNLCLHYLQNQSCTTRSPGIFHINPFYQKIQIFWFLKTPLLCTVGWFAKTQQAITNQNTHNYQNLKRHKKHLQLCH